MEKQNIIDLIEKFIIKDDISIALAKDIETSLGDAFPDDKYIQDTIEILASYCPGGGEFLYNEEIVISRLKNIIKRI